MERLVNSVALGCEVDAGLNAWPRRGASRGATLVSPATMETDASGAARIALRSPDEDLHAQLPGRTGSGQAPQLITTDSSRNSGHDGTNNFGSSIVAKPTSKRMKKRVAATAEIVVGSSNVGSAIHKPQRLGTTNEEEEGSQYRRSGSTAIQSSSSSINSSSDVQSSIVVVDRQKRGSSSSLTLST